MNGNLQINLGTEAAAYIKECLENGNTLASLLLRSHDIDRGSAVTFLPRGTMDEAARQFNTGGKLATPAESETKFTTASGSKWRMVPKPNTQSELVRIIQSFLSVKPNQICICEDPGSSPSDPWLVTSGTRLLTFDDEVYHYLNQNDVAEPDRILSTVKSATTWRFLSALTSVSDERYLTSSAGRLTKEQLAALAANTSTIIVGAYDGEGYVIWTH